MEITFSHAYEIGASVTVNPGTISIHQSTPKPGVVVGIRFARDEMPQGIVDTVLYNVRTEGYSLWCLEKEIGKPD